MNTKSLLTRIGVPVLSLGLLGGLGATLATSASAATLPGAVTAQVHEQGVPDTTFGTVTGTPTDYTVTYAASEVALQHKATIALAAGINGNTHIGTTTVNLLIGNTAPAGSADLSYTLGSVTGSGTRTAGDSGAVAAITGAYTAAFNSYVRDELKFGQDKKYRTGSDEAGNNWEWKHKVGENYGFPGSPNVEGDLIQALLTNPHLQVEVENGLYDLATPFFATEYTMEHLGLPEKLQKNIHLQYYDAGHMMYVHDEDLAKLKSNVGAFIDAASKP